VMSRRRRKIKTKENIDENRSGFVD
jgi:hypothetical protein